MFLFSLFEFNRGHIFRYFYKLTAGLLVFLFLITPLRFVLADEASSQLSKQTEDQTAISADSLVIKSDNTGETNTSSNSEEAITPDTDQTKNTEQSDQQIKEPDDPSGPEAKPDRTISKSLAKANETSGALVYDYPFLTPPGRNGLQPNLNLSYNNQEINKESIFGQGWSLSIPYIERINHAGVMTIYTDNYFNSSLDGELVSTGGNIYGAKVDNGEFLKYTFTNNVWTAIDKKGTIYTFGLDTTSRQDDTSDLSKVYKWMLTSIQDSNNNFISYEYFKNAGQIYPSAINYTGHNSEPGIFRVEFLREARTDIINSYKTTFLVSTNYRINQVLTKVSGNWVKRYNLAYSTGDNTTTSMLTSITENSRDENNNTIALPPTLFEYQTTSNTNHWTLNTNLWNAPVRLNYFEGTYSMDVNGDGYDDILQGVKDGQNVVTKKAYINDGHGGWAEDPNYEPPMIFNWTGGTTTSQDMGIRFMDVNGDSLVDIVRGGWLDHVYINTGSGWSFSPTFMLPVSIVPGNPSSLPPASFANLNGDNLPDIISARRYYFNGNPEVTTVVYINNGSGWTEDPGWDSPEQINMERGVLTADINGDGLDDVVESARYPDGSYHQNTYLNNGKKHWILNSNYQMPRIFGELGPYGFSDDGARFIDINGDGLLDLLQSGYGSVGAHAYINTGNGWTENDWNWAPPITFLAEFPWDQYNTPGHTNNTNGDGQADILQVKKRWNGQQDVIETNVWVNNEKRVNQLKKIIYPGGGSTQVTYASTPLYKNGNTLLNPHLPIILETVFQIVTNDGSNNFATTNYSYEGGYYYYNTPFDYKFAGFSKVTATDNLTKTISFYHQGNTSNSSQGEYQDHVSKIGKMYRQEVYDLNGNLFSKSINKWDRYDLGNGRNFVKQILALNFSYDGNTSHRDSAEMYDYDNTSGNKISLQQRGEVMANDDGSWLDFGTDSYTTTISYTNNTTNGVVGLPVAELTTDHYNAKVKEAKYYYDNLPLGQVSLGNQTKQEQWVGGSKYVNTQKVYNQYGLVTTEIDPLGRQTSYIYDTYKLNPVTVTNPANQATSFSYDYSSGKVISSVDANGQIFSTYYDALDRPVAETQPDPTSVNSSVIKSVYEYTDVSNTYRVKQSNYLDSNNVVDTYTYFDGLGRKVQERREAEVGNQFNVRDFIYGANDLLLKESLPYFSNGSVRTVATTNPALYTTYNYDAMKRVTSAQTAVGTTTNNYDDWKTTVTDAKAKVKDLYKDAYDNLIQVNEHNAGFTYSTYYQWNALKKLTKITDALANVRNFTYDALGRVLIAEDLHAISDSTFGIWYYAYDDASNLISKTAPNAKVTAYTYDNLNRVLSEDAVGTNGVEVTYTYDNCQLGIGRLCSVTNTTLRSLMFYNSLGQLTQEIKRIGKVNYPSQYNYDRQGNQILIINPDDSQVVYNYNAAGLVDSVQRKEATDPGLINVIANIDYNSVGLPVLMVYGNGSVTTNNYDANELYRLRHKVTVADNQNVQDLTYTYDPVGNITQIVDASTTPTAKTTNYTYDDLHRLLSATISNSGAKNVDGEEDKNQIQTFTYDAIGNILTKSDVGTYSYNGHQGKSYANPHAVTKIADKEYFYDENGNLMQISSMITPDSKSFTWDYANRLSGVTINGVSSSYAYDSSGQRIKEINSSGTTLYQTKDYSTGPSGNEKHIFLGDTAIFNVQGTGVSAAAYNIHADHLTGSNVITDVSQKVDELTDYYSFGTIRIDQQNGKHNEKRKFTGHIYDGDTGLSYMDARYYDGQLGRFLSQDSVFLNIANQNDTQKKTQMQYVEYLASPQVLNSYSYVANNPLKYKDVNGDFLFLVVPIIVYAPVWTPIAITGVAAIGAGVASWHLGQSIGHLMEGDSRQADQSLNKLETTLTVTGIGAGGIMGAEEFLVNAGGNRSTGIRPNKLASQTIGQGHAFDSHVDEFENLGIKTKPQFQKYVESVMDNPSEIRSLERGRTAYWQKSTETVVIKDPGNRDMGTTFRPSLSKHSFKTNYDYFKKGLK